MLSRDARFFAVLEPSLRRHLRPTTLLLVAVILTQCAWMMPPGVQASDVRDFVDLDALQAIDGNWQIVRQDSADGEGCLKLRNSKWLMYFLHWRPLIGLDTILSFEYARDHMLNLWGESMPFELSGAEAEMDVCGHRAVVVDGTIYEGRIRTRFILWNCPQSGRQFTADCNINLARGAPAELLEVQKRITETVRCHAPFTVATDADLSTVHESYKWNLAFAKPPDWHTEEFPYEEWYPEGLTRERGSLWTLLTDSDRRIELRWEETDRPVSEPVFTHFMHKLQQDAAIIHDSTVAMSIFIDTIECRDNYCKGKGNLQYEKDTQTGKQIYQYRFFGLLWKDDKVTYCLIGSSVVIDEFWGIPVELAPSDEALERYVWKVVIPNVKVFGKRN